MIPHGLAMKLCRRLRGVAGDYIEKDGTRSMLLTRHIQVMPLEGVILMAQRFGLWLVWQDSEVIDVMPAMNSHVATFEFDSRLLFSSEEET